MPHDNEHQKVDQLILQRLVDNELTHDQVRQLLAEAEFGEDTTKWKQIALAFAENQLFERAFQQDEPALMVGDRSTVSDRPTAGEQSAQLDQSESLTTTLPPSQQTSRSWWPAVLAASLLLAATVAYQVSNISPKIEDSQQVVNSPSAVDSPAVAVRSKPIKSFDRTTLASYEPDHQLEAKDIDTASIGKHSSSIPLYDIGRFNSEQLANLQGPDQAAREAMFSRVLPQSFSPEVVQQLQQSGGMVDQNLEFISGRLDDGRSYLIPYRTIRFLPGQ